MTVKLRKPTHLPKDKPEQGRLSFLKVCVRYFDAEEILRSWANFILSFATGTSFTALCFLWFCIWKQFQSIIGCLWLAQLKIKPGINAFTISRSRSLGEASYFQLWLTKISDSGNKWSFRSVLRRFLKTWKFVFMI